MIAEGRPKAKAFAKNVFVNQERKSFGSGGSMVAKLKLKEIDGRAPPGVELAA